MALTQSLTRFGLATVERTIGERRRSANRCLAVAAQAERARRCRSPTSTATGATGSSTRRSSSGPASATTEVIGQRGQGRRRARRLPAVRGLRRRRARRRADGFRAAARHVPGRPSIWIHVDYYPDRSTDGDVRGFLVTYADVDQLKRLELEAGRREHRLRLVTDSVGSPILHFDRQLQAALREQAVRRLDRRARRRPARPRAARADRRRTRSPRWSATSSARSPARRSRSSGASARRPASCAGCASRSSPTARSAGASTASSP